MFCQPDPICRRAVTPPLPSAGYSTTPEASTAAMSLRRSPVRSPAEMTEIIELHPVPIRVGARSTSFEVFGYIRSSPAGVTAMTSGYASALSEKPPSTQRILLQPRVPSRETRSDWSTAVRSSFSAEHLARPEVGDVDRPHVQARLVVREPEGNARSQGPRAGAGVPQDACIAHGLAGELGKHVRPAVTCDVAYAGHVARQMRRSDRRGRRARRPRG